MYYIMKQNFKRFISSDAIHVFFIWLNDFLKESSYSGPTTTQFYNQEFKTTVRPSFKVLCNNGRNDLNKSMLGTVHTIQTGRQAKDSHPL